MILELLCTGIAPWFKDPKNDTTDLRLCGLPGEFPAKLFGFELGFFGYAGGGGIRRVTARFS